MLFTLFLGFASEGSGAVSYPLMTLLLRMEPLEARDISFMCQSCGIPSRLLSFFILCHVRYDVISILQYMYSQKGGMEFGYFLHFGFHCWTYYWTPIKRSILKGLVKM